MLRKRPSTRARGRASAHALAGSALRVYASPLGLALPFLLFVYADVGVWWALAAVLPWLGIQWIMGGWQR